MSIDERLFGYNYLKRLKEKNLPTHCIHNKVQDTCDAQVMSAARRYLKGLINNRELSEEMKEHNSGMVPTMDQVEHYINAAREEAAALVGKPKTIIEYSIDHPYIPIMFQNDPRMSIQMEEHPMPVEPIQDPIYSSTGAPSSASTVTVDDNTCTFSPPLDIKPDMTEDEVDIFKMAFKKYCAADISTEALRLVAAHPDRFNSNGEPLKAVPKNDVINHPSHYTQYAGVEVIDVTEKLNFNRGNAVKYIARAGHKSKDTEIQDLEKALWYVDRELSRFGHSPHKIVIPYNVVIHFCSQMPWNRGVAVECLIGAGDRFQTVTHDLEWAKKHIEYEIERLNGFDFDV